MTCKAGCGRKALSDKYCIPCSEMLREMTDEYNYPDVHDTHLQARREWMQCWLNWNNLSDNR